MPPEIEKATVSLVVFILLAAIIAIAHYFAGLLLFGRNSWLESIVFGILLAAYIRFIESRLTKKLGKRRKRRR